ncbi:unnamed protein product [Pleuronectes platessa]|uniref:Vitellogenin domain-containing protein n=1 Tax=Pleuronectes platessa TaxID=8262 RepID=A0A9N7UUD1_PLEPL|nr:unnamed protein product [Pleuronectes platessa]
MLDNNLLSALTEPGHGYKSPELRLRNQSHLMATRYKTLHKYEYRYEAESLNAINGASTLKNGPKGSCMVQIEVPQTCSYIVRTTGCMLSEVADMDTEGNLVFRPAAGSDAFAAEMEKYPLKVVVDGVYDVKLYPEEGETLTILNIKRGIISALAVPLVEEDKNKIMPTIHGMCKTHSTVNAREDIATDITLNRDLSKCEEFLPVREHTSPLALISGMHYPLSQLVRSSQTCNYKFDNENKHMTSGSCTERHILIPFSHKGEYGVTNVGKQELTLVEVTPHNDRVKLPRVFTGKLSSDKDLLSRIKMQFWPSVETPSAAAWHMQILRTFDSSAVELFYKAEGKLTPEIYSVAEFMASHLGDCSGDQETTFMYLRGREILMQVVLDGTTPLQKRVAAYLVLMKNPQPSELAQLADALPLEEDQQAKSFVISYITNILSSTEPETQELRQKIRDALQGNEIGATMDPTKFSRNYKLGSVEGNMIFEGTSYLPKEVMLEMTLKAFGYDMDMIEFGMEGQGFEPTVEALFGQNGFFPDTAMKTMFFVSENMPLKVSEMMQTIMPALKKDRMKRQATQDFVRQIGSNLNKLVGELKSAQSPEAMVYMRLLGNELGYLKTNEIQEMAYSATMMIDSMMKMFPGDLMKALMTKTDNTIFAHYIFMDNEFFLPTLTGVPLRIALSGTFTPGIKGGLHIARDMSEVAFMPSAGIEFVTQVGSHIPEYVDSGLEMHTNIFHESGLSAKISMEHDSVKLTIPAPVNPTKLIKMTNTLVAVTGSEVMTIPPTVMDKVDVSECTPFFAGMKYCTALQYIDASSQETTPYFPFTGDSKFAVELHPTGEVTEYTATVAYELLREGEEGRQKVDSVKLIVRAEGAEPTEAVAMLKYNRRRNVVTADLQIPDYDVEAGLRLGVVDGNTKGKGTHSISLDFVNKNIPQLSLVGRANLKAMKEAMLQVQLLVPSLNADATVTAHMKHGEELELELESEIKVKEAVSKQKVEMKYDASKFEVEFKSDVNTQTTMLPSADMLEKYANQLLDAHVGEADMKVRHIFQKFGEAANNYMDKYGADLPYIQNVRVPDMPEISLPETLFLNTEAKASYYFNNEHFTITIPLPLGGKTTEELNFPAALTTPSLSLPQFGLEIVSMEIPIPELVVPKHLALSIPLFGKAEVSSLMKSNLYDAEASFSAGKDVVETPSYSAKFDVKGTSPIDILSIKIEGSGMLMTTDSINAQLKSSLVHKFIEASVSITEDATFTDKINLKSSSKIEATSPFGLNVALEHTGMTGFNTEEISADSKVDAMFKAGPMYGKTISTQSFTIFPFRQEAKVDSTVQIDSTVINAQNTIAASLANGEFSLVSNTNAFENLLTHVGELSFKESKLSVKGDAIVLALGMKIRNQAEASAGASEVVIRMETNADQTENRVYSLLTATLDVNGLAVSSDATLKLLENEAIHKAVLKMNNDGLTTSGTTTLQSPLSLENSFNAELDASRATLSINNKAAMSDVKVDNANTLVITLSSLDFTSKAETTASEYASYTHDILINMKPYTASANVNNNLRLLAANFINEAQLHAELYKMDLTGSLKAIYGEEEIKHIYQVMYADMTANAKCSTTGKLFGTHMNQNTELEVVGLAARLSNDARFNSQPMRFDHTIRCSVVPFDFNLDAVVNADGDINAYGKHSAQLYGKFLLKAQPLAFASSHECRASVTQQLDTGFSLETTFDNKMDNVLTPQEQKTSFRMKSKMNEHVFNQDMSVYNTPERTGIEVSGTILTNLINIDSADNQEFTVSGFLKYDKNTDSHIIQIPLFNNLPALLESMKGFIVYVAETLHDCINNEEIKAKLEALPQHVSDFVSQLNIEGKVNQLKQYFTDLTQEYAISMDDVEASLSNLKVTFEKCLADLTVYIKHFVGMMEELLSGSLPETLAQSIQQHLNAFNEEYDIKALVVYVIDTVREMVQQFDLEKLKGSSIAFLLDIDAKYEIQAKLQTIMSEIKQMVETFDLQNCVAELKSYISSMNFRAHFEELISQIPSEILSDVRDYVRKMIEDLDIVGKINTFYAKMRELIVKFEADKMVQAAMEKAVELIEQFKIEETIQAFVNMNSLFPEMAFPVFPEVPLEKLVQSLQIPTGKLPTIPSEFMFPCFGKLFGEIKFITPIYTIKTSAEFQNSTESDMSPQFSGFFTSQASSPSFESLNYKLDSTAQIALPKMSRVVVAETLKFDHLALGVDHQASVSLYGLSGQAQAKTTVKVATTPYTAEFMNTAFIAMEGGMSASLDTTYTHEVTLPIFNVRSEATLTQKSIARQDGLTLTLTVDNSGTGKVNAEESKHTSNLILSLTPSIITLTFSGDTDSAIIKMKQQIAAEMGPFSYFKVDLRNEAETPFIKNSLLVASANANLHDLKAELKANHDTELYGAVSGVLSNGLNIVAHPNEFVFEFQNKGNAKVSIFDTLIAKIDLQNDYSATVKPDNQHLNTVAVARLNQYKMFYNLTVNNDQNEAALIVAMDGEANLDFLTSPISIPELDLPFVDFKTPAISELNLYEQTGLDKILTTTEQTVDVDAKIVYQKRKAAPLVDVMGLVHIPHLGDLITELSLKSAIFNLNANAGLYTEDNVVFRLGATTVSVFEGLNAKLDGTTSLTTKRGLKLANSLSLENSHIEGTHDSSITVSSETFEPAVSVATIAKISLPILNLEANQNLVADTKTKANAVSTLRVKADFNIPMIKAVGKAEVDHSLKLEGAFEYISMESSTRANMDGTVHEDYLVLGVLDNEFNLYLNNDGLRSTSKIIADAKLNHGTDKLFGMDVNENLAVEASLSRVYAVLKYTSNNEADLFSFNTNGKHIAQATIDFAPVSSLIADIEIDISQPSSLGELTIFEKTVAEVTADKQKISTNTKFISPLYSTNLAAEVEGNAPVFKVTFKSSATSVIVFLEYDLDASTSATFEDEALNMISKVVLTHSDMTMNVNHATSQALRKRRQADDSVSHHTLNVDITSPTFTDMHIRLLLAEMSAPEDDVDILAIRSSPKDADKMTLQISYNMEAPKVLLSELKMKLPSILSSFTVFADKYQITTKMSDLKDSVLNRINEAYAAAINYDDQMSQLSIFYRNTIVEYQKSVQVLLDAVIKVLRETQFKVPGSEEMTTLPEVLKKLTTSIAAMLDATIQITYENMEVYYNAFIDNISSIKLRMPVGDAITGGQVLDQIKATFRNVFDELVDFVKNMESLDTMLVKIGETLKALVEKSQEFVDSIKSDYLDAVFININALYLNLFTFVKNVVDQIYLNVDPHNAFENIMNMLIHAVEQFNNSASAFLQQTSEEAQAYIKVSEGKLELDLPLAFHQ